MDIDKTDIGGDSWDDLEFQPVMPSADEGLEEDKAETGVVPSESDIDALPDIVPGSEIEEEKVEVPEPIKKPHEMSEAERAIVAWKKAKKAADARVREAEEKLRKYEEQERISALTNKLVDEGHDLDTAKRLASAETEKEQTKEMLEEMRFLTANQAVLMKYPEASGEVKRIKAAMQTTGKSVAEVCAFLFGPTNPYEAKARADMIGSTKAAKTAPGAAVLAKVDGQSASLTAEQEAYRAEFEAMLKRKITPKELKDILARASSRKGRSYDIE